LRLAILYTYIQRYYIKTSRELQRLDAITTSPIYAHFSTTLTGVQTIRAFGFQKQFIRENERRMNANNKVYFPQMEVNRWLAQRLEMCGTMILSLTALFGVLTRSWADPSKSKNCFRVQGAGSDLTFFISFDRASVIIRIVNYRLVDLARSLYDCIGKQYELR
jgi:ABC-type multidrug transport system fused ATPase/permease subunit